ncbi:hypothetical protein GCM10011349_01170 [Novosphingobium indicum]|uniref:Uncharacterized protein n=1 Tax=Novosphingobium indicum TaxID=462949 RepID=A0ABQ2J853_9SPHN|nr:hypothetical protein GCM10011349_01170 [Novosphingobium indicum]
MDVGHAAVLRILDGNDGPLGTPFLHGIQRILKGKTRQRQTVGVIFERRTVRVAAGRTLQRDGAGAICGSGLTHAGDEFQSGSRIRMHDGSALKRPRRYPQWLLHSARADTRARAIRMR